MTARILAYANTLERERALPLAHAVLETMERSLRDGTARPIRGILGTGVEGLTEGDDLSAGIVRIDAGAGGARCTTIEQFAAVVRTSMAAIMDPWIDPEQEASVRRWLEVLSALRGHEATVARGDAFPIRVVATSASPWAAVKAISICVPPLPVFGVPIDDDGLVMPRMVTMDAEMGDDEDAETPLLPRHVVLRTMSGGWSDEPTALELLRLHAEKDALDPAMARLAHPDRTPGRDGP